VLQKLNTHNITYSLSAETIALQEDEANGLGPQCELRTDFTNLLFEWNIDFMDVRNADIRPIVWWDGFLGTVLATCPALSAYCNIRNLHCTSRSPSLVIDTSPSCFRNLQKMSYESLHICSRARELVDSEYICHVDFCAHPRQ
jgi:hypothetical protein